MGVPFWPTDTEGRGHALFLDRLALYVGPGGMNSLWTIWLQVLQGLAYVVCCVIPPRSPFRSNVFIPQLSVCWLLKVCSWYVLSKLSSVEGTCLVQGHTPSPGQSKLITWWCRSTKVQLLYCMQISASESVFQTTGPEVSSLPAFSLLNMPINEVFLSVLLSFT